MHELGIKWSGIRVSNGQVSGYQLVRYQSTKWSGIRVSSGQVLEYQMVRYQQYSCKGVMCGITVHLSIGNIGPL